MFLTIAFISFLVVLLAMIFAPSDASTPAPVKSVEAAEVFSPALHV